MLRGELDRLPIERASASGEADRSAANAAWLAALPCAIAVAAAVVLLGPPLSTVLYPSTPPITLIPDDTGTLRPEPLEGTRYLIALSGPLLLTLAILVLARMPRWLGSRPLPRTAVVVTQVLAAALVVAGFVGHHDPRWEISYFNPRALAVAGGLAAAALLMTAIDARGGVHSGRAVLRRFGSRTVRWILGAAAVGAAAIWILPGVNSEASITWAQLHHDTAFHVDETFAVLNGLTPLVDFHAQYASLFPYAIALALLAFGKTVLVFTIAVCALSALAFVAIYGVLRRASGSAVVGFLLFLPFLATSLFNPEGLPFARFTPGTYFPMFPFRYGGAYLLAWLVARRLERGGQARMWPLFVASGFVIFNNFEFGVPAFGATVAALLATSVNLRREQLGRLAGQIAIGLGGAAAALSAVTLVRAGSLPDFAAMPLFSRLYGVSGYSVAPMPGVIGLPLVIFLTYVAAIGTAVVRALDRASNQVLTGMLVWTAVFGLGTGSYYVARSDPTLMPIAFSAWALALALLTIVVLERWRTKGLPRLSVPAFAVLFGMGLAVCSIAQFPPPWTEIRRIQTAPPQVTPEPVEWSQQPTQDPEVRQFVSSIAKGDAFVIRPGAPIALFLTTGHRIADAYDVVNVVPFTGAETMHTLEELEEALDALREAGGNTVLLQDERARGLRPALERRGFRILTDSGLWEGPWGVALPPGTIVIDGLTKWVDTTQPHDA